MGSGKLSSVLVPVALIALAIAAALTLLAISVALRALTFLASSSICFWVSTLLAGLLVLSIVSIVLVFSHVISSLARRGRAWESKLRAELNP
jgi:hypothetical protein